MPTSLSLDLLRAKLVLACAHTCPVVIHSRVTREQPDALSEPWFSLHPTRQQPVRRRAQAGDAHGGAMDPVDLISETPGVGLRDPRLEERHVVMNSRTWTLRELGGEEEARTMANNPSVDAGRGVRLYREWTVGFSLPSRFHKSSSTTDVSLVYATVSLLTYGPYT